MTGVSRMRPRARRMAALAGTVVLAAGCLPWSADGTPQRVVMPPGVSSTLPAGLAQQPVPIEPSSAALGASTGSRPVTAVSGESLSSMLAQPNPTGAFASFDSGLAATGGCPGQAALMPVWGAAGRLFGISWTVLAGITQAETSLGCDLSVSSAGAQGWTQFMPSTWATWGTDADADGTADPYDDVDAIFSTARYLAASGAPGNYRAAIFAYNHSEAYVNEVLGYAAEFEAGQPNAASATADLGRLTAAERRLRARAASDTARAQKIRADVKNTETAVAASSEALERVEQRLSRLQEELARLQAVRRFEAARFETTGLASREAALAVASGSRQNPSLVYLEVSAMQTAQTRAAASLEHREQHARTLEGPLLSQVQALNAHAAADRQALAQAQQLQENAEQAEQKASGLSVVAHAGAHPHR